MFFISLSSYTQRLLNPTQIFEGKYLQKFGQFEQITLWIVHIQIFVF